MNVLHCTAKLTIKRRLAQLKNARLASVAHFKKQKLERIPNTEQPRIDDNELNTNDTGDTGDTGADTDEEGTWFWNQSANELESDSECDGYSDSEGDSGPEAEGGGSKTEKEALPQNRPREIKWNKKGEESLRGVYGQGSVATFYRKKKAMKKWEDEGHKLYNIQALWQRNRDLGLIFDTNSQQGPCRSSDLGDDVDLLHPERYD